MSLERLEKTELCSIANDPVMQDLQAALMDKETLVSHVARYAEIRIDVLFRWYYGYQLRLDLDN
jgi:hypothetical protein